MVGAIRAAVVVFVGKMHISVRRRQMVRYRAPGVIETAGAGAAVGVGERALSDGRW